MRSDGSLCRASLVQFSYDQRAALATSYRILKPGGVLLVTVPGISQISRYDMDSWGEYWRYTALSATTLFEEIFPTRSASVEVHGKVLAATAFLHGFVTEELRRRDLDQRDRGYELVIGVQAVKPRSTGIAPRETDIE